MANVTLSPSLFSSGTWTTCLLAPGQAAQRLHVVRLAGHADFHPGINRLAAVVFDRQFGFGFQDAAVVDDPRALVDVW